MIARLAALNGIRAARLSSIVSAWRGGDLNTLKAAIESAAQGEDAASRSYELHGGRRV